jgi:hypothetical protein
MHAAVFVTPIPCPHGGCCLRGSHSYLPRAFFVLCSRVGHSSSRRLYVAVPVHPRGTTWGGVGGGYTVSPAYSAHDSINDQNI